MSYDKDNAAQRIYICLHEQWCKTNCSSIKNGIQRFYNTATVPDGTILNEKDITKYFWYPKFINIMPSKYLPEDIKDSNVNFWRYIPEFADKKIRLQKYLFDENQVALFDEDGKRKVDIIEVDPKELKEAIDESRIEYYRTRDLRDERPIQEQGEHAKAVVENRFASTQESIRY